MKLIGSAMSPYVRRLRLWLAPEQYEYIELDIYSEQGREVLKQYTPIMKIPVLVDGEQTIFDSRLIQRYLSEKQGGAAFSWDQQNLLTLIDSANDAFVIQLLSKRSGADIDQDALLYNLQRERVAKTMALLEQYASEGAFKQWDYVAITLYCLLDWIKFRELFDVDAHPALKAFMAENQQQPQIELTDPRNV